MGTNFLVLISETLDFFVAKCSSQTSELLPCTMMVRLLIDLDDDDRENNRDPELECLGIFRPTGRKVEDRMTKGGTTG